MTERISIIEIQNRIENWIQSHGGYWPPLAMLSALFEEIGELAREINHLQGYKPKRKEAKTINLGEELADIVYALICIANYYKVDLNSELINVLEKYSKRDSKRFI